MVAVAGIKPLKDEKYYYTGKMAVPPGETLKDIKECYPLQISEYTVRKRISDEPAFSWWIPRVIKKQKRIISKIKSKYWIRKHKFGIKILKSITQARKFDEENGETL